MRIRHDASTTEQNKDGAADERGMTLVEVMIAAMILAIATLATFSAWMTHERLAAMAREEAIAQAAINEIISRIRATPFEQITNSQSDPTNPGFSGGDYPGVQYRLLPGQFPARVGSDSLPHGLRVGTSKFSGSAPFGDRYAAPDFTVAELRVIFVNDENPVEVELGEVAGNRDGLDLNRNGRIDTSPYPTSAPLDYSQFNDTGAQPLFPRKLASGTSTPVHQYLNSSQLVLLPVAVQVRWWSNAGVPREITVVTFLTNRS